MMTVTIVLSAIAAFWAFWAGVVSLIGFGGWRALAQQYPAPYWPEDEGVRVGWQSARVGMSSYNSALNAVVTADGFYLKPLRAFAYNHPPVFIPWEAIERMDQAMLGGVKIELEEGRGLRLGGRLGRTVRDAYVAWDSAYASTISTPDTEDEVSGNGSGSWRRTRAG